MRTVDPKIQVEKAVIARKKQGLVRSRRLIKILKQHPEGVTMTFLKKETGFVDGTIGSIIKRNLNVISVDYIADTKRKLFIKIIKIKKKDKVQKCGVCGDKLPCGHCSSYCENEDENPY